MHVHGSRQSSAILGLALLPLACLSFLVWWQRCHRTDPTNWMPLGSLMVCAGTGLFWAAQQEKEGPARHGERSKAAGFAVSGGPSEIQLRLLLDSTAEGIYALDLDGNCIFCNSAGLRLLIQEYRTLVCQFKAAMAALLRSGKGSFLMAK